MNLDLLPSGVLGEFHPITILRFEVLELVEHVLAVEGVRYGTVIRKCDQTLAVIEATTGIKVLSNHTSSP